MRTLPILELCAGYGGIGMAVEALTGDRVTHVAEVDPSASKVLAIRYPDAPNIGDITAYDWSKLVGLVDTITAGWPCQGISEAGHRRGLDDERSGIWHNVAEAIGVLRPRVIFLENVRSVLRRGGPRVVADLARLGYRLRWTTLRASNVGAPHHRDRWFLVALRADAAGYGWSQRRSEPARFERRSDDPVAHSPAAWWVSEDGTDYGPGIRRWERILGRPAPYPTSPRKRGTEWRASPRYSEWLMGLPDGWVTDVPGLTESQQLERLGGGVVPQQAYAAFKWLTAHESFTEERHG
ncbi:DNA cytosine methyltransferase [Streptomyces sp. NPDC052687]|uniref:DNA cytosine methyltransferase n=1 Tax=Streptomyces sp. NPDC052687 TaxID=3154759 RepID=UPI00344AEBD4